LNLKKRCRFSFEIKEPAHSGTSPFDPA